MRIAVALLAAILSAEPPRSSPFMEQGVIFRAGSDGYLTYRIPAIIVSPGGVVLAFAEGRKNGYGDSGDIDLLLKRSLDGGKTWSPHTIVANHGADTIGNPCPVVDRKTRTVFLLLTGNPGSLDKRHLIESAAGARTVWITKSTDDGATWSGAVEITKSVKDPDWGWYATGPGVGIQLKGGRLVVPSNHRIKGRETPYSHVIYSDDHGATWKKSAPVGENTNESQAVELTDGSVMINARSYHSQSRRAVAISRDGGATWSPLRLDETLVEPTCQASFLRLSRAKGKASKDRLLFANPAHPKQRVNLTVRLSYDEGKTWSVAKSLEPGPSSYSSLTILPDGTIACLYEKGPVRDQALVFARFNLEWLTDGNDSLP